MKDTVKDDKDEIASLKNEFEVAQSLNSPFVLKAFDHGVQNGVPYTAFGVVQRDIVQKLLRMGMDIYGFMLPKMVQKSAEALYYFHTKDWIHRDVKVDNFLVTREGEVKLIDYRIAEKKRTGLKAMFHKPKVQGLEVTCLPSRFGAKESMSSRTFILLAACFTSCWPGRLRTRPTVLTELLNKHLTGQVPSPMAANANVSPEFADLVKKMMAKKKESRPSSMWEFLKDLRTIQMFKKVPRLPDVHPFDQLEKGEKGFNLD
ncbi:MAG: protein kinase [Pirellulaceae bacterium]